MNPFEVLYSLRMLLDDTRDWYFPNILWAINKAQIETLREYYESQDEVALRPFYRYDRNLQDGDIIGETDPIMLTRTRVGVPFMYPRVCYLYLINPIDGNFIPGTSIRATYIEPVAYFQHPQDPIIPFDPSAGIDTLYPKTARYTVVTDASAPNQAAVQQSRIRFPQQSPNMRAEIYYIAQPDPFDIQITNGQVTFTRGLTFDKLYHPEIIGKAAEILNNQDVMETDRGDFFNVYAGDRKLTFEQALNILRPQGG